MVECWDDQNLREKSAAESTVRFTWPGSAKGASLQWSVDLATRGFKVKYNSDGPVLKKFRHKQIALEKVPKSSLDWY